MQEKVLYVGWKTGKFEEYILSKGESETNLLCPLDDTFLVFSSQGVPKYYCPNCGIDYQSNIPQKDLITHLQQVINKKGERLVELHKETLAISNFLVGVASKVKLKKNKANLSTQ